jgi:uncharacterized Zn finger protein
MSWWRFKEYVPVAKRRANATREVAKLAKKGQPISPVKIAGRAITTTFWGQAWCQNLEAYSDFSNRLPRGRSYVRNGSVVDLQIEPGLVTAMVSGSELYQIRIQIEPLKPAAWRAVKTASAGQIGSLVELLQGRLSKSVMKIVTRQDGGLFPKPREIEMSCSCPDWAGVCKHVAATFYGVAARLDRQPELLFKLRQVDHLELVEAATEPGAKVKSRSGGKKTIAAADLADVFGIELAAPDTIPASPALPKRAPRKAKQGSKPGTGAAAKNRPRARPAKAAVAAGGESTELAHSRSSKSSSAATTSTRSAKAVRTNATALKRKSVNVG